MSQNEVQKALEYMEIQISPREDWWTDMYTRRKKTPSNRKMPQSCAKDGSYGVPLSHLSIKKVLAPTEYMYTEREDLAF